MALLWVSVVLLGVSVVLLGASVVLLGVSVVLLGTPLIGRKELRSAPPQTGTVHIWSGTHSFIPTIVSLWDLTQNREQL
ncbi:hypothetical protein EYF80_032479 [Liparis tanakae]|uniref:Uncharacterized protein n=1 Tax=Liparis tanakae TaxID=230148 RepID=A0A4Z2GVN3_9TELE|nr:hypothetical protein EYF80_032479 [Liparis tanakae]